MNPTRNFSFDNSKPQTTYTEQAFISHRKNSRSMTASQARNRTLVPCSTQESTDYVKKNEDTSITQFLKTMDIPSVTLFKAPHSDIQIEAWLNDKLKDSRKLLQSRALTRASLPIRCGSNPKVDVTLDMEPLRAMGLDRGTI